MALSKNEVEHVALLARLYLNEVEKEQFGEQLNAILGYMEKLNDINTDEVEPLVHLLPINNVFRSDIARHDFTREEIIASAPVQEDGQFKVPKII